MDNNKKGFDVWRVISLTLIALYGLFLLYPLFCILKEAVYANGKFTLEYFVKFFSKSYYAETLLNSFILSSLATIVTLIIYWCIFLDFVVRAFRSYYKIY